MHSVGIFETICLKQSSILNLQDFQLALVEVPLHITVKVLQQQTFTFVCMDGWLDGLCRCMLVSMYVCRCIVYNILLCV